MSRSDLGDEILEISKRIISLEFHTQGQTATPLKNLGSPFFYDPG